MPGKVPTCPTCGRASCYHCWDCGADVILDDHRPGCRSVPPVVALPRVRVVSSDDRPERLALNLWDLDHIHPAVRAKIMPLLDLRREAAVWVDPNDEQETAVPFVCLLKTAALAADLVRGMARQVGDKIPRVYLDRRGRGVWTRLSSEAVLTSVIAGCPVLNPDIFTNAIAVLEDAPEARRIEF